MINYSAVINEQGQPVWYLTYPQGMGLTGDLQKQPDGTYTAALYDPSHGPFPAVDAPATYYQFDDLGNLLHIWKSPDSWATNEHDFRLLPDGTGLLLGIIFQYVNMAQFPGGGTEVSCNNSSDCPAANPPYVCSGGTCDATVYMDQLEQIAPDGGVLWSWNEFDHIPVTDLRGESYQSSLIDASHSNSIEIMDDGNYLVNMRDMSQAVKIDKDTGDILWILGGAQSSFQFVNDPLNGPSYQHGTRELPNHDIIMFDNGCAHPAPYYDRAVEYALDTDAGTATLVWEYNPPTREEAIVFGLSQRLDGGNTLITFGSTGLVQEVDPDGGVVWNLNDTQPIIYTDGGSILYPDGGVNLSRRDWGIYRSWRIDTVY